MQEEKLAQFGSQISLRAILKTKGIDEEAFLATLQTETLRSSSDKDADIEFVGILPCPVKIPLMETYDTFAQKFMKTTGLTLHSELKPASMGTSWIAENISQRSSATELPHLFISAGFDLFFDTNKIGRFRTEGVFSDRLKRTRKNPAFAQYDMEDPEGNYTILSGVPAVFLVNCEELAGRDIPRSWKDILAPEFAGSISLPVGDFDLFNAILLSLTKAYGPDAIRQLGRAMQQDMHPSEMVKSAQRKMAKPAVTIMPYFFTKTVQNLSTVTVVWPEDGAVLSPIFMLSRRDMPPEADQIVEFFGSKEVGEILAHKGLFPSLHADVENKLPEKAPFLWVGWDFLRTKNMGEEISRAEELFYHEYSKRSSQ